MYILIGLLLFLVWLITMILLVDICETKNVEINILTMFICFCPVINTVVYIYLISKDAHYKNSLKQLFNESREI